MTVVRTGTPRVVLACDFFQKYTAGLADGLAQAGAAVTLLTRDHGLEFGGDADEARRQVDRRLGGRVEVVRLPGRVRDPTALGALARARWATRRPRGVVHLQDRILNDPRLVLAAGVRPGRYALTVHDPVPHPGDARRAGRKAAADRRLLRGAALLFVHADALRDELVDVEAPRAPVVVVPHGADPPEVARLPDDPTLLFFGRLSHYKGLDVLLDAMDRVWAHVPRTRLVIAGEGDLPSHPALSDRRVVVRREHVPESDVSALFAEATALVLPYRQASQSGVGSLAKSYGRASIVTRLGGLPELVSDGSGVVVAPEDPAALADAAVRMFAEPGLAETLGRRGAERLAQTSSWRRVAELTLDAYRHAGLLG